MDPWAVHNSLRLKLRYYRMLSSALKRHPKCAEYTTTLEYGSTNGVQLPRGVSTYSSTGNHVRTALRSSSPTYLPAHAERVLLYYYCVRVRELMGRCY